MCGWKTCEKYSISVCFFVLFIVVGLGSDQQREVIPDRLMEEVYQSYKNAVHIAEGTVSARRVFSNNRQYEIHVMKLNEVNGNKRHNLLIKDSNDSNPLIYIDNPVETKLPHAFLPYEEFKKVLTDRVLNLRQRFVANASKATTIRNPKSKSADKNPNVKAFKKFLDRLIKLQEGENKENVTKKVSTKDVKVKGPVFRIFTLKTDANPSTRATKPAKKKSKKAQTITSTIIKETTEDASDLVTETVMTTTETLNPLETPTFSSDTENPTDFGVTEQFSRVKQEPPEIPEEFVSSSMSTTTVEMSTKRSTLGRPLVFVEGDEKPEDDGKYIMDK